MHRQIVTSVYTAAESDAATLTTLSVKGALARYLLETPTQLAREWIQQMRLILGVPTYFKWFRKVFPLQTSESVYIILFEKELMLISFSLRAGCLATESTYP